MGKKKSLKQKIIRDDILFNFIEDTDDNLIKNDKMLEELDLLVDNNQAAVIKTRDDTYSAITGVELKYTCRYMCHLNKDIKKYIFKNSGHKLFTNIAYIPKEYEDISKYLLYPGVYYAQEKENTNKYLVLIIEADKEDAYLVTWSLYFVGKKCIERKNEFLQELRLFEDSLPFSGIDKIQYLDGRPASEGIFKTFDQMVFTDKDKIIKYIENWKRNIPKYNEYGMIPKLSILLYGEPGCGKSTFCKAVAKYLDIHIVNSLSPQFFDNDSEGKKRQVYKYDQCVYSIDDIDTICASRDDDTSRENNKALSTLLDFLDNPPAFYYKADDGKYYLVSIVCASTNYIDKLDKAVKRSGRFDLKIEMNKFTRQQAQEMCDIYGLKLEDIYDGIIDDDTTFIPAHIQALCTENIDDGLKTV